MPEDLNLALKPCGRPTQVHGPDGFTIQYKTELVAFDTDELGQPIKAPTVRAMTAVELEKHKAKKPLKPDVAAENATDAAAIGKLERDAPDVLRALREITKPTLLRDFAPTLDATADGADEKDEEKGTPFNCSTHAFGGCNG
jgi:hypothetical protein